MVAMTKITQRALRNMMMGVRQYLQLREVLRIDRTCLVRNQRALVTPALTLFPVVMRMNQVSLIQLQLIVSIHLTILELGGLQQELTFSTSLLGI